jgi:hypothetical protein
MVRCGNCGTDNLDGSEFCDECGARLIPLSPPPPVAVSSAPSVAPRIPPPPPPVGFPVSIVTHAPHGAYGEAVPPSASAGPAAFRRSADVAVQSDDRARGAAEAPSGVVAPAVRAGGVPASGDSVAKTEYVIAPPPTSGLPAKSSVTPGASATKRAKLIIQRGGTIGKEFPLTETESNIGRWDADGGIFPDVDLDQDDPEAKVSRRHARIICQEGQYFLEDLGSTNGTFINRGRRLLPGNRHPLNDGDEIIVGKTFLKFIFI